MLNIDKQIEILRKCECPKECEVREICNKAKEIFDKEQNLVRVNAPVTVLYSSRHRSVGQTFFYTSSQSGVSYPPPRKILKPAKSITFYKKNFPKNTFNRKKLDPPIDDPLHSK